MTPPLRRHWLITAFEPFGGRGSNNSRNVMDELVRLSARLEPASGSALAFHFRVLPMEYDRCADPVFEEMERLQAAGITLEGILSLGEGAEEFKIETQANNLDDVPDFADNRGVIRAGRKIFPDLEEDAVIPLSFPLEAFSKIRSSRSPGFFVCNHLCARVGRTLAERRVRDPATPWFGFIHVPREGMGGIFTADVCATIIWNGLGRVSPPPPQPHLSGISSAG